MRQHRVRRLPVEGFGGTVAGILLLTEATMTEVPDQKKDVPAGMEAM